MSFFPFFQADEAGFVSGPAYQLAQRVEESLFRIRERKIAGAFMNAFPIFPALEGAMTVQGTAAGKIGAAETAGKKSGKPVALRRAEPFWRRRGSCLQLFLIGFIQGRKEGT